ncbi:MAG TPA: trehalase family glycosidase [Anaerolineae bacterium]|nr:trehalase family glycosidase [Anaerolineae bacterium]
MNELDSPYLTLLKDRIDLRQIPFSERGSRLLLFQDGDHLQIKLAERWFKIDQQLTSYRQRPPLLDEWRFTDGDGTPLKLEITTYPHRLDCRSAVGTFSIVFADAETLVITLPPGKCGLTFQAHLDQIYPDRRGGILRLTGDIRRNIAYTTNARIARHVVEADADNAQRVHLIVEAESQCALQLNITPRLGFNRYIAPPQETLAAATQRWQEWFATVPAVSEPYRTQYYYAWWIMRAGLISTRFYTTREAMTPSKIHYVGVWQWDAYFHALAYRHIDMKLAKDQLRVVLDHQRPDGMIPDAIHDEGTVTRLTFPFEADVTKPPLLGWAAWKLYEFDHDVEFLNEVYEPIVRWNNWWFEKNDVDGNGLCEYLHPYSSGLDDSPLWDEGMPVESPDLNTYLYLQQEALSRIAFAIGEADDGAVWAQRAEAQAARMVRWMWDEDAGLFWAKRPSQDARVNVRTPFNLFPLITGQLPESVTRRLVGHLTNENEFWTHYPVPTVALNDSKYDALTMWRGPVWVNVNYLLIEGLQRTGHVDLARELRRRTLDLLNLHDDIYEYYQPQTGEVPPKAASLFGWSSAIFIDLAIQAEHDKSHGEASH